MDSVKKSSVKVISPNLVLSYFPSVKKCVTSSLFLTNKREM